MLRCRGLGLATDVVNISYHGTSVTVNERRVGYSHGARAAASTLPDARLAVFISTFTILPQSIDLRERKCQWHPNPPRGPSCKMKARLRTKKVTLRNDSGHSPGGSGERDVVRIS